MYNGSEQHRQNLQKARLAAQAIKVPCAFCARLLPGSSIKRHEAACYLNPVKRRNCKCGSAIKVITNTTCSTACFNRYHRSGVDHPSFSQTKYRNICFMHHEKRCVVCGEQNVVEVHHHDGDHSNDAPGNLVPLCPTHHKYMHSRHRHLISEIVDNYVGHKSKTR